MRLQIRTPRNKSCFDFLKNYHTDINATNKLCEKLYKPQEKGLILEYCKVYKPHILVRYILTHQMNIKKFGYENRILSQKKDKFFIRLITREKRRIRISNNIIAYRDHCYYVCDTNQYYYINFTFDPYWRIESQQIMTKYTLSKTKSHLMTDLVNRKCFTESQYALLRKKKVLSKVHYGYT